MVDPTEAFNLHVGSVARGAGARRFTQRTQLLDFSLERAREAERAFAGDSAGLEKLARYRASLETMVKREAKLGAMSEEGGRLAKARDAYLSGEPSGERVSPLYDSPGFFDRLQAQTDMVTAALIGGLTQCAVVSCAAGSNWSASYPEIHGMFGVKEDIAAHTDLRHGAGLIGEDLNNKFVKVLTEANALQVRAMCSIAAELEKVREGDGTMLDRTALVYLSDSGEKHHSAAEEWATLIIGGDKLGLKTDGRSVAYPKMGKDAHRQVSNLFNTLGHAAGLDLDDFGGESEKQRVALGPLAELFSSPT